MPSFARFQERNNKYKEAAAEVNSHFLIKGFPSIKITNGEEEKQAAVVNRQEQDKAYIYTALNDELTIGSVWQAKNLHFLISEEIVIIKNVNWHKYIGFLCNVDIDNIWGYFIGPEKQYVDVAVTQKSAVESRQKPVLILPSNLLEYEDTIVIGGRPWLVQEYDTISTPGICYYSLTPTTATIINPDLKNYIIKKQSKTTDLILEPVEQSENKHKIAHNVDITLSTEKGFFKYSNKEIKIKKHTATEVVFCLPFGVDEAEVQTKEKDEIYTETFVAVD